MAGKQVRIRPEGIIAMAAASYFEYRSRVRAFLGLCEDSAGSQGVEALTFFSISRRGCALHRTLHAKGGAGGGWAASVSSLPYIRVDKHHAPQ